jgi:hypothetical protein
MIAAAAILSLKFMGPLIFFLKSGWIVAAIVMQIEHPQLPHPGDSQHETGLLSSGRAE